MKAAIIEAPGKISYGEVPDPAPAPDEVVLQVAAAGLCGTDLHILRGEYEAVYPIIPGHEFAGTVVEVGNAVKDVAVGMRATADPNIFCHECAFCRSNKANQCANLQAVGVNRDGAFAEYVRIPRENLYPIGEIPFIEAAFAEPLGCVVLAMQRAQIAPGSDVLLLGAGPMGCLLTQAVSHSGAARLTVVDLSSRRLELARALGATDAVPAGPDQAKRLRELAPDGFDVVIDATGVPAVVEGGFAHLRKRGKYLFFGVCPTGEQIRITPYDVFRNDWQIIGSFALSYTIQESIRWLQSGRVRVAPLISHEIPLSDVAAGLERAQTDPERMKILFLPGS
ncbi:MAG: zinc-dependent alcohol dehydrogenase family protein [Chloroflexi bacterium]|nr:zinc-dependent alcohol dehydrogenase family protein [Chloroflexota bacterium]